MASHSLFCLLVFVPLFLLQSSSSGENICSSLFTFHKGGTPAYEATDDELELSLTRQNPNVTISWSFLFEENPYRFEIRFKINCGNNTSLELKSPHGTSSHSFQVPAGGTICTVNCCFEYHGGNYFYKTLQEKHQLPSGISTSNSNSIQPSITATNTLLQLPSISMDSISFTISHSKEHTVQPTHVSLLYSVEGITDTFGSGDYTQLIYNDNDVKSSLNTIDIESANIDFESSNSNFKSTDSSSSLITQEFTVSTLFITSSTLESSPLLQTIAITSTIQPLTLSSSSLYQTSSSSLVQHKSTTLFITTITAGNTTLNNNTLTTAFHTNDLVVNIVGEGQTSNFEIIVAILSSVIAISFFIVLVLSVWSCVRRYLTKRLKGNVQLDVMMESHRSTSTAVVILEISPSPSLVTILAEPLYNNLDSNDTSPPVQCRNSHQSSPLLTKHEFEHHVNTIQEQEKVRDSSIETESSKTTSSTKTGSISSDDSYSDITVSVMERVNTNTTSTTTSTTTANRILCEGIIKRQFVLQDSSGSSAGDITSDGSLAYYRITDDFALQDRSSSLINVVFV